MKFVITIKRNNEIQIFGNKFVILITKVFWKLNLKELNIKLNKDLV